jgi:MFS family permease
VLATAAFAATYPFVTSVGWLIGLGLVEGTLTISGLPSLLAEVSRAAEQGHQARTQGVFQTVQTATQIAGSLAGGALFTVSHTAAFRSLKILRLSTERRRGAASHTTPPPGSPGRS